MLEELAGDLPGWISVVLAVLGLFSGGVVGSRSVGFARLRIEARRNALRALMATLAPYMGSRKLEMNFNIDGGTVTIQPVEIEPTLREPLLDLQSDEPLADQAHQRSNAISVTHLEVGDEVELLPWTDRRSWSRVDRKWERHLRFQSTLVAGMSLRDTDSLETNWSLYLDLVEEFERHLRYRLRPNPYRRFRSLAYRLRLSVLMLAEFLTALGRSFGSLAGRLRPGAKTRG